MPLVSNSFHDALRRTSTIAQLGGQRVSIEPPLHPSEEAELQQWLAEDRRHVGAFARARAVSVYFDTARNLGNQEDPSRFAASRPVWRRVGWRAAGASAAVAFALALVAGVLWRSGALSTSRGEVRMVALSDGSSVTLNTSSRLRVSFTRGMRQADLLSGEVLFTRCQGPRVGRLS